MAFYERRTSGLPPSAMEYAMPIIQYGRQIKADRRAEEDYGLRRQWEEEDRALRQKQLDENKALAAEERAYQRGRDTKKDMWEQEQLDRAELKDLETNRRWDKEQEAAAARDTFNQKYQSAMLKLNTKIAEAGKMNPMMAADLEIYKSLYKTLGEAVNNQADEKTLNKIKGDIVNHKTLLKTRYPQLRQSGYDPDMGLAQPPQRGRISQADKALAGKKQVIQTGTDKSGRKVVKYSDGTIEYAN